MALFTFSFLSSSRRKPGSRAPRACWLPWTPAFAGVTVEKIRRDRPHAIALPHPGGEGEGWEGARPVFYRRFTGATPLPRRATGHDVTEGTVVGSRDLAALTLGYTQKA